MTDKLTNIDPVGSLAVPDYLKGVSGREGLENVTQEDLIIPRLMVCQALSPQKKRNSDNYIAGLEDGNLFNTVTGENYGNSVELVPLLFTKSRIFFNPLEEGGGIRCQSFNGINGGHLAPVCGACAHSQFGEDGETPECTEFMNFASLLLSGNPPKQLIAASFKSSALKAARNWVSRMQMMNKPSFCQVYEVRTVLKPGKKGEYYTPVITFKRFLQTQAEFEFAQLQYEAIKGRNIKTDEVESTDAAETAPF